MIVAEHVQNAVNDEPRHLFTHAAAALAGMLSRDVGADIDVADDRVRRRRAGECRTKSRRSVPRGRDALG